MEMGCRHLLFSETLDVLLRRIKEETSSMLVSSMGMVIDSLNCRTI